MARYDEEDPDTGSIDDEYHYVALGFSDDPNMGDDTVYASSYGFGITAGSRAVQLHYNYVQGVFHNSFRVGDDLSVHFYVLSHDGGALRSAFDINTVLTYIAPTPRGPVDVNFNFYDGKYIMLSAGPLTDGLKLGYHSVRAVSQEIVTP